MPEWLTFTAAREVITTLLALYAALLSTINWRQAVRKDRRRLKVEMQLVEGEDAEIYVAVEVANIGHRAVIVKVLGIEIPNDVIRPLRSEISGMQSTPMPVKLSDGDTAEAYYYRNLVAFALKRCGITKKTKISPVCVDSAGGVHRGRKIMVDPKEWGDWPDR